MPSRESTTIACVVKGALDAVAECRHPTIAMIHGPCIGGGFEIACQCDLRISGRSGRFGLPITRLGFAVAYDELAAILPITGKAVALEILIEGRVLDAAEAYAKGLLTRVVPDEELEQECRSTARRNRGGCAARQPLAQAVRAAPDAAAGAPHRGGNRRELRVFRYGGLP
jgi:enoyl-CoA hydratase/carnithine racemase